MFEIFLTLFPLTLGNGCLACTNFEALAAVGASENLVDAITGFTATRGALVPSVDKILLVGSPGVVCQCAWSQLPTLQIVLVMGSGHN